MEAEYVAAVIAVVAAVALGITMNVAIAQSLLHLPEHAQSAVARQQREAQELAALIPSLPTGTGMGAPIPEGQGFTSLPPHEEALFLPYETRLRTMNKTNLVVSATIGGAIFVFATALFFAFPAKDTTPGSMTVQPAAGSSH